MKLGIVFAIIDNMSELGFWLLMKKTPLQRRETLKRIAMKGNFKK